MHGWKDAEAAEGLVLALVDSKGAVVDAADDIEGVVVEEDDAVDGADDIDGVVVEDDASHDDPWITSKR